MTRRGAAALGLALSGAVMLATMPPSARADEPCRVVLDRSVVVERGVERGCAVWVVGNDATIERGAVVNNGVTVAFGRAAVDGEVTGSVNVINGDAAIGGRVGGDVYATGTVRVGADARIDGNVTGGRVDLDPLARIGGATARLNAGWAGFPRPAGSGAPGLVRLALNVLITVLLAALFGALATLAVPEAVESVRRLAGRGPGWGFVATMLGAGCLLVDAALMFALRPLPLGRVWVGAVALVPVALAAYGALGLGQHVGARLLPARRPAWQTGLGLAALALVMAVFTQLGNAYALWLGSCIGGLLLFTLAAWSIGLGLLSIGRAGRRSGDGTSPAPAALTPSASPPAPPPQATASSDSPLPPLFPSEAAPAASPLAEPPPAPAPTSASPSLAASSPFEARAEAVSTSAVGARLPATEPTAEADALDLRRIPGITPIYAHLLRTAGIASLNELARQEPGAIVASLAMPNVLPIDVETAALWIDMARRRLGR